MKKSVLLLIILCILPLAVFAETMYGIVLDSSTLRGISDVEVSIAGESLQTTTDLTGMFKLNELSTGSYQVKFYHQGFTPVSQEIVIPQQQLISISMNRKAQNIDGISITETRAESRKTPVAQSSISNQQIRENLQGQDLPLILDEVPGLFAYSESGSGSGYSYLKMRGFNQKRIGVMINGIPLNDPEDHSVYWVNMPDFAESVQDIQFQRGVGASHYGIASFGGSLNIETTSSADEYSNRYDELYYMLGSYNTRKMGLKYNSALSENLKLNIRLSKITSDGYRDKSASELTSLYTSLNYKTDRSVTEFNFYTGHEITQAAWYASWEEDLAENHQHNPITYDNEIDDFEQLHLEIHNIFRLNDRMQLKNTAFYINGSGYYEKEDLGADLWEYGLADSGEVDLIRQKWVEKDQFGLVSNIELEHGNGDLSIGTYLSTFASDHWGEVDDISSDELVEDFVAGTDYYKYQAEKNYITAYINENYLLFDNLNLMANLHYQYITYDFEQKEAGNFTGAYLNKYKVDYSFLNPQLGVNYNLTSKWNIYANAAIANREPADNELYDTWDGPDDLGKQPLFSEYEIIYDENGEVEAYEWSDPLVESEFVIDYEAGIGFITDNHQVRLNAYYMDFQNEIVDYGGVDDSGGAIRGNADATVHRGIELEAATRFLQNWQLSASFAYADNYFRDFQYINWADSLIDLSGNKLGGSPKLLGQAKLRFSLRNLNAFLQAQYTGKQYLDNSQSAEHIINESTVWNLGFDYKIANLIGNSILALQFRVNNVFDLKYETAGYLDDADGDWEYDDNFYFPAAERNFTASLRLMY
ncbi:MAG: TonB-dependent receptor [Candidatus Cloacimonetes bacterium]|nr:TonB-dependent receptor [Candidatus Cloacimonadota bacterium]